MIFRFLNILGAPLVRFWQYLGEVVLLAVDTFTSLFSHKLRWKLFLNQIVEIGLLSQLVVIITGGFTGAVFSAQTFFSSTNSAWVRPSARWFRSQFVVSWARS